MSRLYSIKARGAVCAVCLTLPLLSLRECAEAATITNILICPGITNDSLPTPCPGWLMQVLNINVGDTVVWANQQASPPTNFVESYGGEWRSPQLNPGDSFSFTFTNSGFYAYRTGLQFFWGALPGTIAVSAWTNAPPAVTLNSPVNGFVFPRTYGSLTVLVQASVANEERIARIEYYANTNLIGTAYSPPFGVQWEFTFNSPPPGPYALVAEAVGNDGSCTLSQPVNVLVGPNQYCWGTRVLPGGQVMFYYAVANGYFPASEAWVDSSDNLATVRTGGNRGTQIALGPGVFVDESPPAASGQCRFYSIYYVPMK